MTLQEAISALNAKGRSKVGPDGTAVKIGGAWVIEESPTTMADEAGLDFDTYALARMVASEVGDEPAAHYLAVAECAVNRAAMRGISVGALLIYSSVDTYKEQFGENAAHKWASTQRAANERAVLAATIALGGSAYFGGDDFFSPRVQDKGKQGDHLLTRGAAKVIKDEASDGEEWIGPCDGIDAYTLCVLRFVGKGKAQTTAALQMVGLGGAVASAAKVGDP